MARQLVEVIDRHGHVVESCTIELDDEACMDVEYEEVAIVLAQNSGRVPRTEHIHLRARCVR
ncbi:MAG: hypothetical protein JO261_12770 [Alphaproteobacteria bacterium]|nr:hypothetical protein [Alphaproteobacteria bacterium]MBV9694564.1 hypothetical protein [Alphaproteobacteria bacterium]